MRIRISKHGKEFEVVPVDAAGSSAVGRGRTLKEAYGDFLIAYQRQLGIAIEVEASAQPAENKRRRKELARR